MRAGGLRLAVTTLSVARVRGPERLDRGTAGSAMALAPLVGAGLGLAAAAVLVVVQAWTGSPLLAAVLAVAALALLTRGLHLDGLADTVDGLASYRPPEGARAVMRSPEVGPLGAAALLLVPLTQVAALAAATGQGRGALALVVAVTTGRAAVTLACTPSTPAAAPEGMGALVAGTVPRARALAVAGLVVVAAGLAVPLLGALAALTGLGVAVLLLRHAVRRLGGVSGDVLGALVEVTTAVVLVVLSGDVPRLDLRA